MTVLDLEQWWGNQPESPYLSDGGDSDRRNLQPSVCPILPLSLLTHEGDVLDPTYQKVESLPHQQVVSLVPFHRSVVDNQEKLPL